MIDRFVLHVYDRFSDKHIRDYELTNLTMEEVFDELQLPPDRIIGCEPPPPHETMLKWAKQFRFDYQPELYEYGIGSYDRSTGPHDTSAHPFECVDGKWREVIQ